MTCTRNVHAAWLEAAIGSALPVERQATCDHCAMCEPQVPSRRALHFLPDVKCCSYWPNLPNYLVGAIFRDDDAEPSEGARRLAAFLDKSWAVPLGIGAVPGHKILYSTARTRDFGNSLLLRCPYFQDGDGGNCTIWKHRNSVCSTWFCRHEAGADGRAFWEAVRGVLSTLEKSLSVWCARNLGVGPDGIRASLEAFDSDDLGRQSVDGRDKRGQDHALWAPWHDRRRTFYVECFNLVNRLSWEEVRAVGGATLAAMLDRMLEARQRMLDTTLPEGLRLAPVKVLEMGPDRSVVVAYADTDPLVLDTRILHSLRHCDGRSVTELRGAALRQDNVDLSLECLQTLRAARVIVAAGAEQSGGAG